MRQSLSDHDFCLRMCKDQRATEEERNFLAYCAGMYVNNEPLSKTEYNRMSRLTGAHLSVDGCITDRPIASERP